MKRALKMLLGVLVLSTLVGCAALGGVADITGVPPEYAKALSQIQKIVKPASPIDGYTFQRIYKYKGSVCEAKDITWDNVWSQSGSAAKDVPPAAASTATASTSDIDDQTANEIADILKGLGLGE